MRSFDRPSGSVGSEHQVGVSNAAETARASDVQVGVHAAELVEDEVVSRIRTLHPMWIGAIERVKVGPTGREKPVDV